MKLIHKRLNTWLAIKTFYIIWKELHDQPCADKNQMCGDPKRPGGWRQRFRVAWRMWRVQL